MRTTAVACRTYSNSTSRSCWPAGYRSKKATSGKGNSSRLRSCARNAPSFSAICAWPRRATTWSTSTGRAAGEVRNILTEVSRTRGLQGFSPSETATFVFSLKKPLFSLLRRELGKDADTLGRETWQATEILDKLGLFTTEMYQKSREEMIHGSNRR